jgi:N,N'-diacetyllegionaminate synthase
MKMIKPVKVGDYLIGSGYPCFIIAEAGVNHNGRMDLAYRLVDIAVQAGANAIKFQCFVTEELVTPETQKADYQIKTTSDVKSQFDMLKALELPAEGQEKLKEYCTEKQILYLCTPYETTSVDMLEKMDISAYKIASTDITNIPFLRYIAGKGRPVILSTGMSTLAEVEEAVTTLNSAGLGGKIILLHCTSEYPAPIQEVNLRAILTMQQAFSCLVGFSDHTAGLGASPWAVALGACVIEKHFTLDRDLPGPDHRASLTPDELSELVHTVRQVELSIGDGVKQPMPSELKNKPLMQKSLVARCHIRAGERITPDRLTCKRPGFGLSPSWFDRIIGKRVVSDISQDEIITLACIDWNES